MSVFPNNDIPGRVILTPDGPLALVAGTEYPLSDYPHLDVFHFMGTPCEVRDCTVLDVLRILGSSRFEEAMSASLHVSAGMQDRSVRRLWAAALMEPADEEFGGSVIITPEDIEVDDGYAEETRFHLYGKKDGDPRHWALEFTPMANVANSRFEVDMTVNVIDFSIEGETFEDKVAYTSELRPSLHQVAEALVYEMTWFGPMMPEGGTDLSVRGVPWDGWERLRRAHAECERQIARS